MSWQVNFRLFVPDCEYWEAEVVAKLQRELHESFMEVIYRNGIEGKQVGLSSAEISYLNK